MSGAKKVIKDVATGGISAVDRKLEKEEKRAKERAERQAREAEEAARKQAELEAAQQSATSANIGITAEGEGVEIGSGDVKDTAKKKKLRGGKKSLNIARSSGSGINV